MTAWGLLLLALYVGLGVSGRATWRKAGRLVAVLTGLVMVAVFASYGAAR